MALERMINQIWKGEAGSASLSIVLYAGMTLALPIAEDCVYVHLSSAIKAGITNDIVYYGIGISALTLAHIYSAAKAIGSAVRNLKEGRDGRVNLR